MASTDLIVPGDESPYALLRMDGNDALDLIKDALGGDSLSVRDLDRIKVPSGGGVAWEIPSLDGTEVTKSLKGVIIHKATRRVFWDRPYGEEVDDDDENGGKPACQSYDGDHGIGNPGGDCATCPLNEWESAENGKGKACRESRQLFILTEGEMLPITLTIPPGSLGAFREYTLRCLKSQKPMGSLVTEFTLDTAVGGKDGKTKFSKVQFARAGELAPEAVARVKAFENALMPAILASAEPRRDETEDGS
jgi:hypothetical protein